MSGWATLVADLSSDGEEQSPDASHPIVAQPQQLEHAVGDRHPAAAGVEDEVPTPEPSKWWQHVAQGAHLQRQRRG
eukprot:11164528-Lingulodinium_polyedra.AAC.1